MITCLVKLISYMKRQVSLARFDEVDQWSINGLIILPVGYLIQIENFMILIEFCWASYSEDKISMIFNFILKCLNIKEN